MFTLPIDRVLPVEPTIPGKPVTPQTFTLTTVIQAGAIVDSAEWIAGDQLDPVIDQQFNLDIIVDETVVASTAVGNTRQTIVTVLPDTKHPTDHTVIFKLTGKNQQQTIGHNMHLAVDLRLYIDGVSLDHAVNHLCAYSVLGTGETKPGGTCWAENGQMVLNFTTPVYIWMLSNEKLF